MCTRVCSPQIPFCQELKVLKYLLMNNLPPVPASLPSDPAPSPVLANQQAALERWGNTHAVGVAFSWFLHKPSASRSLDAPSQQR